MAKKKKCSICKKEFVDLDKHIKNVHTGEGENTGNKGGKLYFYWVTCKAYITDKKVIQAGLYRSKKEYERLVNADPRYIETYENELPEVKVYEIAKQLRVKMQTGKGKLLPVEDILDEIVKEIE